MTGEDLAKLRALYLAGPECWAQADLLAAAAGLRRDDVLTGEDLARRMDAFYAELRESGVEPDGEVAWLWREGPGKSAAFSPLASRYLLSGREQEEPLVIAVTGDIVRYDAETQRFRAAGQAPLAGRFAETLRLAAAALRAEGHSPRLAARIEAWIAEGRAPSFGEALARLTGDEGIAAAAGRADVAAVAAALAAWPELLRRPREVLGAIGEERRFEHWIYEQMRGAVDRVQRCAGGEPLRETVRIARMLLTFGSPWRLLQPELPRYRRYLLAALDEGRRAQAADALERLEGSIDAEEWPPAEIGELRGLAAARADELAAALAQGDAEARAASAIVLALRAFSEGDAARALALVRQSQRGEAGMRQRESLLGEVREALRALLGYLPGEE